MNKIPDPPPVARIIPWNQVKAGDVVFLANAFAEVDSVEKSGASVVVRVHLLHNRLRRIWEPRGTHLAVVLLGIEEKARITDFFRRVFSGTPAT